MIVQLLRLVCASGLLLVSLSFGVASAASPETAVETTGQQVQSQATAPDISSSQDSSTTGTAQPASPPSWDSNTIFQPKQTTIEQFSAQAEEKGWRLYQNLLPIVTVVSAILLVMAGVAIFLPRTRWYGIWTLIGVVVGHLIIFNAPAILSAWQEFSRFH